MNKYFTTRSVNRPWNIGDTRTAIYCDNNRESIATVHKRFPDAIPVTREHALQLVRQERSIYRDHLSGEVVDCETYGGNWYTVSVAVGDEIHSVIESISYPVGAIVWAYMYNGDMQTVAVQHQ